MAIIYNTDSEFLREPNLLIPGKKPIGRVAVNYANPITNDIKLLFLPSPSNKGDLVHGTVPAYVNGTGWQACYEGMGWRQPGGSVGGHIRFPYRPAYRFIGDWTVFWRAYYPTVQTGLHYIFGNFSGTAQSGEWYMSFNGGIEAADELYVVMWNTAGNNVFLPNNSCPGVAGMYSIIVTWDDSIGRVTSYWLVNNSIRVSHNETNGSYTDFIGLTQDLYVSNYSPGPTNQTPDAITMAAGKWNRMLTPEEIWSVHYDPYQLVIPA